MAIYNGGLNIIAPDISGKEDKSNKVTAWSSTTTDAHYPSEKLVKDALDGKAEKSEIEASVTTNSLTAGAILPKGSANIGSENAKFNNVYADTLIFNSLPLEQRKIIQEPLFAGYSYPNQAGYIKCISVKVTYTYANAPIRWRIGQRGFGGSFDIVLLLSGYDHPQAGIDKLRIMNTPSTPPQVYAVVADATTVDIYIRKTEPYDAISIINCECPDYLKNTVQIGYPFTFAESVPSGAVTADCPAYLGNAGGLYGAVFNDLADAIPVGEGDVLEAGYCYGFDGEHYIKTSEYMQKSYIGIHSDTFGFLMGHEEGKEKLNVAVSGFVLAYADREYEVGTPLTCTADGYLTEIKLEDKIKYPERVIATYWKNEPNEEWGPEGNKIKVNGRKWVKVK